MFIGFNLAPSLFSYGTKLQEGYEHQIYGVSEIPTDV